jgi:hypothetical protein
LVLIDEVNVRNEKNMTVWPLSNIFDPIFWAHLSYQAGRQEGKKGMRAAAGRQTEA